MNLKSRISKLENQENKEDEFIMIIDDTVYFKNNIYQEDEFYNLYPEHKKSKCIEIE